MLSIPRGSGKGTAGELPAQKGAGRYDGGEPVPAPNQK
jgi:hypothetical protein